jgi:hypothetical protein
VRIGQPLEKISEPHPDHARTAWRVLSDVDRSAWRQLGPESDGGGIGSHLHPDGREWPSHWLPCRCARRGRLRQSELCLCDACDGALTRERVHSQVHRGDLSASQRSSCVLDSQPARRTTKLCEVAGFDVTPLSSRLLDPPRRHERPSFRLWCLTTRDDDYASRPQSLCTSSLDSSCLLCSDPQPRVAVSNTLASGIPRLVLPHQ